MHSLLSAEHQPSPVAEMGDTLEFNEIYQEVKGSWVSIPWVDTYIHIFVRYEEKNTSHLTLIFAVQTGNKCGLNLLSSH